MLNMFSYDKRMTAQKKTTNMIFLPELLPQQILTFFVFVILIVILLLLILLLIQTSKNKKPYCMEGAVSERGHANMT